MGALAAFARDNVFPLAVYGVLRVWTLVWAALVAAIVVLSAEAQRHYYGLEPQTDLLSAPWQRWDTIWYAKIALEGYAADERAVFAPLYPLLMRWVSPVTGSNVVSAGLVVASVGALASFVLMYRLGRELLGESAARRALIFLAAFPTGFFLFAAYTEALFLALALGAFVAARKQRWELAGALGGLAALTRPQGVLFLLALGVEFFLQHRRGEVSLTHVWTLIPVALGGLGHLAWLTFEFGSPDVWFQAQALWHRAALPWDSLGAAWSAVIFAATPLDAAVSLMDPFFATVFVAALFWSARRLPVSMTVYMATIVVPPLFVVTTYSGHYPLTAMARYVVVAFPFFLLLGSLRKSWWQLPLAALLFSVQMVWMMLFVAWVFVR
jgi:hypothetical protein